MYCCGLYNSCFGSCIKSSMVLQMRQQGNLQDYPGGPSVVRGLSMAAMSGWGDISREATLNLGDGFW